MGKIYTTLLMCKPENIPMISEKPSDPKLLMTCKLDCSQISRLCSDNARIVYSNASCIGNYNKTSLHQTKNIQKISTYLKTSVTESSLSLSESKEDSEKNDAIVVNI